MKDLKKNKIGTFIKSPPAWFFIALGVLFVLVKLGLTAAQQVLLDPEEALLDDMMMFDSAVSITQGNWLGDYDWMTLSKHKFFSLWLALLHVLHIPYLLGGQLLWAAAAILGALALAPALKKRWLTFALFSLLLFNPASWANGHPAGFVTRVYRDNIFPALCLLCIAGIAALALRYRRPARQNIGWAVLAGLALAASWLTREDGWWLIPFVAAALLITLVFILRGEKGGRLRRCALLLVPVLLLYAGVAAWSGVNYAYYGRFIVSDFSSGEFADAYGAMTRIQLAEDWDPNICVPYETRRYLYDTIPEFAILEKHLESERFHEKYNNMESGGFYWALREAAGLEGLYETPQTAQAYFAKLAADINALCDSGAVPAGPRRSSVSPPIDLRYVPDVLKEGFYGIWFCAAFQQCEPYSIRSEAPPDMLRQMEEFLHTRSLVGVVENTSEPYFSSLQKLFFAVLQGVRYLYAILLPLGLAGAVAGLAAQLFVFIKNRKAKPAAAADILFWWLALGLILCALLRAFMIAFVTVSSFNIGTYVMYLATVHPLLILFAFTGCVMLYRLMHSRERA